MVALSRKQQAKKRATISDIALQAEVSLVTVSRVLNSRQDVAPVLRRRVQDAVRALHYVKTGRGRKASRETRPIVTFLSSNREFLHPMHARMLQGAERYWDTS